VEQAMSRATLVTICDEWSVVNLQYNIYRTRLADFLSIRRR